MAKTNGMAGVQTPKAVTETWLTPPFILNALGPFDLDPCAAPEPRPWSTATTHYTFPKQNGLLLPWHGRVWMNPPYGKALGAWMRKLSQHGRGTSLVFARTETEAFMSWVWQEADAVMFLHGRLHFCLPDGSVAKNNAGAPSVLIAYGADDAERLIESGLDGTVVPLKRQVMLHMALHVDPPMQRQSWKQLVLETLHEMGGKAALQDLYRALESHPKAMANPNFRAKIRQTAARARLDRVEEGVYALAG